MVTVRNHNGERLMSAWKTITVGLLLSCASATAPAAGLGSLKGAIGGSDAGSLLSSNAGNAAGIVQFCIKNKYLGEDVAGTVKDRLLGKLSLGGGAEAASQPADDEGYANGLKGLLSTQDGKSLDLSDRSDKLKEKLTEKACDVVLDQAKGMLGG